MKYTDIKRSSKWNESETGPHILKFNWFRHGPHLPFYLYFIFASILNSGDPFGKEKKRLKYLDQEECNYTQYYLDQPGEQTKDVDPHSLTTDRSDSGMLISNSASSEVGTEDTSGKQICDDVIRRYANVEKKTDYK